MFDFGDHVEFNGHKARIKSIWVNIAGKRVARIEFDDSKLCPPIMEVDEDRLISASNTGGDYYGSYWNRGPIETHCPKCNSKWTVTKSPVIDEVWKDCPKCKKRKEDI